MVKVSFIVPVYNAEKTLVRCVESILNQGFSSSEIEIILVNDGSTDHSLDVCRSLQGQYDQIQVFDQENQGAAGYARNLGISHSSGEFISFVDSDDYLVEGSIGDIFDRFEIEGHDAVRYWIECVEVESPHEVLFRKGEVLFDGDGYGYMRLNGLDTYSTCWLYRREYLLEKGFLFSGHRLGEDILFITSFLLSNPRILTTSSVVYVYMRNSSSITRNLSPTLCTRCVRDSRDVIDTIIPMLEPLRKEAAYAPCIRSLQRKIQRTFIRMLDSNIQVAEAKEVVSDFVSKSLLPLPFSGEKKDKAVVLMINTLSKFPWLLGVMRFIYHRIVSPLMH